MWRWEEPGKHRPLEALLIRVLNVDHRLLQRERIRQRDVGGALERLILRDVDVQEGHARELPARAARLHLGHVLAHLVDHLAQRAVHLRGVRDLEHRELLVDQVVVRVGHALDDLVEQAAVGAVRLQPAVLGQRLLQLRAQVAQ